MQNTTTSTYKELPGKTTNVILEQEVEDGMLQPISSSVKMVVSVGGNSQVMGSL